jgi:sialate O-acetylesterase
MNNCKTYLSTLLVIAGSFIALRSKAEIVLPRVIGSDMVLQRQKPLPIWGTASVGEQVTVKFGKQVKHATADTSGKWKVILDPLAASGEPEVMTISGTNTIKLENILVGEVWLCSGQSNMEYEMRKNSKVAKPDSTDKNSPVDELEHANNHMIRIFWVNQKNLKTTGNYLAKWNIAQDSALKAFSAAGYFFAKNLYAQLHVPIGIISSAISGSRIEPWAPAEAYALSPYFKEQAKGNPVKMEGDPGKFYHSMIEPLAPFAIRGFLWYQGESGVYLAETISYTHKMQVLIDSWRKLWGNDEDDEDSTKIMPFYYVQLPPYYYSHTTGNRTVLTPESLPEFREAQTIALNIPGTGMIVTTDLNDDIKNLHPPFKWEVGRRLALVALAKTYKKKLVYSGPMYQQMHIVGNKIELEFNNTGSALISKDGKPLNWFTIAGSDGKFVEANAVIKGNKVIVSSADVSAPVAVRFAWNEAAQPNFFNKAGLPASPFRTDDPLKFNSY